MRDNFDGSTRDSTSVVPDDEESEDESEIMTSLGCIESKLDQVLTTQAQHIARLYYLEVNIERTRYPWYNFTYLSHMVS